MNIRLIEGQDIDKVKWNSCVHYAINGNIFGYKWFLDHVAKDWDALVEGDYESVFPLVWKEGRFGNRSLYQPSIIRELGIYSINTLSQTRVTEFINHIPEEYKSVNIALNERNFVSEETGYELEKKQNHQLYLGQPYEILSEAYDADLKAKLQEHETMLLIPASNIKPERIADFYKKHTNLPAKELEYNYHAIMRVMYNALHRGWGFATGVTDREQNLLAVNFFLYSHNKVMSFLPVESPEGKAKNALYLLMDMIIQSHANKQMILDFNTQEDNILAAYFNGLPNKFFCLKKKNKRFLGIY
ncbi:MAG: hypothetical protein MK226_05710 [Saprospiraceae bacterium]|nr:hypothetical protein [Saprospiraceae bacterium]